MEAISDKRTGGTTLVPPTPKPKQTQAKQTKQTHVNSNKQRENQSEREAITGNKTTNKQSSKITTTT